MITSTPIPKPSDFIRKGWCQDAHALTYHRRFCDANDSLARCWDILGALGAARARGCEVPLNTVSRLTDLLPGHCNSLTLWNDRASTTQQDVIRILEEVGL